MMERRTLVAVGLAAPALLRTPRADAQSAGPAAPPAFHKFQVGSTAVTVLRDGGVPRPDIRPFVTNATGEQVEAAMRAANMPLDLPNTYNPTAVQTRSGLVLIDVGFGQGAPQGTGGLKAAMRAAGLDPDAVAAVVFTHFHPDHVSGLIGQDGQPAYPNARILVPENEWAFWMSDEEMARATTRRPAFDTARQRFAPYATKVERFRPGAEVVPGLTSVASFGHSPGHCSYLVSDGSAQALIIGDAVNLPALFMANPEWVPPVDMDPATAVATRRALLDRAATERMPVVGYHFPMPATGHVERSGTGYRLAPTD